MTQRDWTLAVAAGLMALPACSHLRLASRGTADRGRPTPVVQADPAQGSPYHPRPAVPVVEKPRAPDPTIQPVIFPQPAEKPPEPTAAQPDEPARQPVTAKMAVAPADVPEPEPKKPEEPLVTAVRCLLEKRPADAVEALKRYDKANQELLLCLLPMAQRLTQSSLNDAGPQETAAVLEQLDSLAAPLRTRAALGIDHLCFCREIKKFGVYTAVPADHAFAAGDLVHVYAEVRNFASERQGPFHVTRLACAVQLRDWENRRVWPEREQEFPVEIDRSLALRHDYYLKCSFCLPAHLPPGSYTVFLQVEDVPTGRLVRRSLDFRVTARSPARGS